MIVTLTCPNCGKDRSFQEIPIVECRSCRTAYPEEMRSDAEEKLYSASARAVRALHGVLVAGLIIIFAVFGFLLQFSGGPLLPEKPWVAPTFALIGIVVISVAVGLYRPKIPRRNPGESRVRYWTYDARVHALATWNLVEGAGIICAVGFYMSGSLVLGVIVWLAVAVHIWLRPGALEAIKEDQYSTRE